MSDTPTRLLLDGVGYEKDTAGDGLYWTRGGALIAGNVGWAFDHIAKLRAFVEDVAKQGNVTVHDLMSHGLMVPREDRLGYRFIWEERGETNG